MKVKKKIKLELENGMIFVGNSFGAEKSCAGEVVFNTAMTGYPESLSDPSYKGQILTLTYPLVGNYGVPPVSVKDDIFKYFESEKVQISGLIISDYSEKFSHWNAFQSLGSWLKINSVPGIYGIDTRRLTRMLREKGTMLGRIITENGETEYYDPNKDLLIPKVSVTEKKVYGKSKYKVLLIDCGVKNNIIRCLLDRGLEVIRVPYNYNFSEEEYHGVVLTNGPGNPNECRTVIEKVKGLLKESKPIFGICLGNQIIAIAAGAEVFKLKYGHRSHNQPVRMVGTHQTFITSQNHGYAIKASSIPRDWEVIFENLNDMTVEGIQHKTKPFVSVQFHPEASGGPSDTMYLFDEFINKIKEKYDEKI